LSDPVALPSGGLTDGLVTLRPAADADVPAIVEACRDPAIQRYTRVPANYDDADARDYIERSERGRAEGTEFPLLVVDAEDGSLLGSVGIHGLGDEGSGWVGYWVAPQARGRGVAARALSLLCGWAFEELDLARIEAQVEPENERSQRVLERVGFQREGLLRSYLVLAGERRDMLGYSLLPGELR
jgi:ribosomal-protein-alanine N-acetyltransferase